MMQKAVDYCNPLFHFDVVQCVQSHLPWWWDYAFWVIVFFFGLSIVARLWGLLDFIFGPGIELIGKLINLVTKK